MKPLPQRIARMFFLSSLCLLGACAEIGYYAQAIHGHSSLMRAARPVADLLADPASSAQLRQQLARSQEIRSFASRELGLPDNGSYRSYAALGRSHVVWNVFAAPEFSLKARTWCMWIVGCVGYRGYFDRADAEALASELRAAGFDVHVAGVPAYSTLGHFDDPLLDTFLRFGETEVARLIFHELAHQRFYLPGDSAFNESFATAVENAGLNRWLAAHGTPAQREAHVARRQRKAAFLDLVERQRQRLAAIYAEPGSAADRRAAKLASFAELRREYAELKAGWGGATDFDRWFADDLNNAKIVSLALYTQWVPAFARLLEGQGGDLPRFYRRVEELAALPASERKAALAELM